MGSSKKYSAFGTIVSVYILLSCSVVKDSDVTSLDQLNNLKLASIEIIQNLKGSASSSTAPVVDSLYNTPSSTTIDVSGLINGLVVKQTTMAWPAFAKTKMQFRSKITAGILIKNYFYQNGKPRASAVYQNNKLKELYSFYYDKNYNLLNIYSRVFTSITAADTVRDSLVYSPGGYLKQIIRKSATTPSKAGTINFSYTKYSNYSDSTLGTGGNSSLPNPTYGSYQYIYGNCFCPNSNGNSCFGCDAQINSSASHYLIQNLQVSTIVTQLQFEDVKIINAGSCGRLQGSTDFDTYYFHPLMILKGLFARGDILLNIYAIDWWQPGAVITSSSFTTNETVTLNFNYAR